MKKMNGFDFGGSRILVCAQSPAEIRQFQRGMASAAAAWEEFILGVDPLTKLRGVDLVVLLVPCASAAAEMLLKQVRRQFSLLEMPVLLLAEQAADGVFDLISYANDFMLGSWEPQELRMRLAKLLQVRQEFLETAALNLTLHGDLHDRSAKLQTLIENGLLMSATRDVSQLFRHALWEGKRLLHCDAGSLYLVTPQKTLRFAMRTKDDVLPVDEIPLHDANTGAANAHYISVHAALHAKSVLVDDVYRESRFDVSGTKAFDRATGYKTVSVLTVPMASRGGAVSGVFQFINRMDPQTGAIVPFPPGYVSLVEALAAQAAVTYENLQLLDERRAFTGA